MRNTTQAARTKGAAMKSPHWVIEFSRTDLDRSEVHAGSFIISKRQAPTEDAALVASGVNTQKHIRASGTEYAYHCIDSDVKVTLVGATKP